MNAWILIVVMSGYGGNVSTVSMQEFNTEQACKYAANYMTKFYGLRGAVCFEKGKTK